MMNVSRVVMAAALVFGLEASVALPVHSQDKVRAAAPTTVVACQEKSYPNLPGQNSFSLRKERDGTFTAVTESYGKPKTYPHLKCAFHSKDGKIFFCGSEGGTLWGVEGQHLQSTSVETDGTEQAFDGYLFEVVKYPLGEPTTVFSIRFAAAKCSTSR